jgi:hypothetical protein
VRSSQHLYASSIARLAVRRKLQKHGTNLRSFFTFDDLRNAMLAEPRMRE